MKISIITAAYNNQATITDAINSVLTQQDVDLELIVIDGGSTDGTLDILRKYSKSLTIFVSEPDQGIYDALNKGINLAQGDIIGFLHSDDLLANDQVLNRIASAFADPTVDAVYGDLLYVTQQNTDKVVRYWRSGDFTPKKLKKGWMPPHPTFYVRSKIYKQFGTFDLSYKIAADYDCILRFLGRGAIRCHYIPEILIKMRVGGVSNRSLKNIIQKSLEDYKALRSNKVGGVGTLLLKNILKIRQFFVKPTL